MKNDVIYIPGQAIPFLIRTTTRSMAITERCTGVYSPDYLREDKTVRVETNLYATATPEGEFVWTGISDTFNPNLGEAKAINAVVKVVVKDLEKEGIF